MGEYQNLIDILIILIAIISYALCITLYFRSKKKKNSKFATEIIVIFLAILISTVIKALIFIFEYDVKDFNGILGSIIAAIFTAIGGLQFEGLPLLGGDFTVESITGNLKTLYYVSSLWSGLIFLTIFSFAISVEFAHTCKLRIGLLINKLFNSKKNIYVFASVTEDALTLAHSIEEHHREIGEKCVIIFSGNIGAFDKLNPLCAEIFSSGYIYHSINESNNKKTVLETLKIENNNKVSLFAFDLNEHSVADDEKNAEAVFSETERMMNKLIFAIKKNKNIDQIFDSEENIKKFVNKIIKNTINFYVLTKNETNTRAFEWGLKDEFIEKFNQSLKQYDKNSETVWKYLSTKIQITPINEADLAAKDFNRKRINLMIKQKLFNFNNICNDYYKVLSLGFGEKGRAVMSQLYESSAVVDYNGNTLPFFANVFDERIDTVSGTFLASHPMFVNIENNENNNEEPVVTIKKAVYQKLKCIYGEENIDMLDPNTLPRIKFNKQMCLSNEFFKFIDSKSGIDISTEACSYDAIIIALGEDTLNIRLANALIRDIANEYDKFNAKKDVKDFGRDFQFIGVNVRNDLNLKQLEYDIVKSCVFETEDEFGNKKQSKTFAIITFGDAKEMYTYDNIIGNDEAKEYSYRYNILYNHFSSAENKKDLKSFCNEYYNGEKSTLGQVINLLEGKIMNVSSEEYIQKIDEHWKTEKIFGKKSNVAALNFKNIYEYYLSEYLNEAFSKEEIYLKLLYACKLEHERWMRFHIANGFKYSENHNKMIKKHQRIVAFEKLPADVIIYDAINVAMAFSKDKIKK